MIANSITAIEAFNINLNVFNLFDLTYICIIPTSAPEVTQTTTSPLITWVGVIYNHNHFPLVW